MNFYAAGHERLRNPRKLGGHLSQRIYSLCARWCVDCYNEGDAKAAGGRTAESLRALATQLKSQYASGMRYFVGDALSALDIYWTAFANLLDPSPKEQCPMPETWRPGFVATDPIIKEALDPLLLEHRSRIFREHFCDPMEL
jgi:glutathione S-transferase